ncbi:MAG: hypothetical protein ACTS6A_02440 [Candidatus Hodgkinia cicadicola]
MKSRQERLLTSPLRWFNRSGRLQRAKRHSIVSSHHFTTSAACSSLRPSLPPKAYFNF